MRTHVTSGAGTGRQSICRVEQAVVFASGYHLRSLGVDGNTSEGVQQRTMSFPELRGPSA